MTRDAPTRDSLRAAVLLLSLFLVVRTAFVEPFGVPTGSMAPTLLGNHREAACPECGFPVRVGHGARRGRGNRPESVRCPNCDGRVELADAPSVPGDRLLVGKCVYPLRSPRRWEVAVFRCPVDDSKPYVKRVVGLPGEAVQLRDGDAYADGELLRKTLAQAREARVLLFDQNFVPGAGWGERWLAEPVEGAGGRANEPRPAGPEWFQGTSLMLSDPAGRGVGLTYRNWLPARGHEEVLRDWSVYNGPPPEPHRMRPLDVALPPVHDFFLECEVEVVSGVGVLALRLGDGGDHVTADIPVGDAGAPKLTAQAEGSRAGPGLTSVGGVVCLPTGRRAKLEFTFVDRRASLALDGVEVVPALDLPAKAGRGSVSRPLQVGVRGAVVAVHNVKLWRDVHYRAERRHAGAEPCRLGPADYFVLGDNGADSQDSREWEVPGVPAGDFLGKPLLVHRPMRPGGRGSVFDGSRLRWLR